MVGRRVVSGSGANNKKRRNRKWHWEPEEDERLIKSIAKHRAEKWRAIARDVRGGRSAMSCRLRWVNHLQPNVDKSPLNEEEREKLIRLHGKYGSRWAKIVPFFPNRTDNHLKNQFHAMLGSRKKKVSIPPFSIIGGSGNNSVGSSSVYGRDEVLPVGPHSVLSCGTSVMSEGGPTAVSQPCQVAEPEKEVVVKEYKFIDFMGVGSLE